jgi:hypothetical protein
MILTYSYFAEDLAFLAGIALGHLAGTGSGRDSLQGFAEGRFCRISAHFPLVPARV